MLHPQKHCIGWGLLAGLAWGGRLGAVHCDAGVWLGLVHDSSLGHMVRSGLQQQLCTQQLVIARS